MRTPKSDRLTRAAGACSREGENGDRPTTGPRPTSPHEKEGTRSLLQRNGRSRSRSRYARLCPLETKVRQNNPKSTAIDRAHPHGTPEARRDAREALTRPHKIAPKRHKREHQWRTGDKSANLSSWGTSWHPCGSHIGERARKTTMVKNRKPMNTTLTLL